MTADPHRDGRSILKKLMVVFALLGTILLFFLLGYVVNLKEVASTLALCKPFPLITAAILSIGVNFFLSAYQWKIAHDAAGFFTPMAESVLIKASLYPIRLVLPSKTGDLSRALYLVRVKKGRTSESVGLTFGIIALDTILLLATSAIAAPFSGLPFSVTSILCTMTILSIVVFPIAKVIRNRLPNTGWSDKVRGLAIITDFSFQNLLSLISTGLAVYLLEAMQLALCMAAAGVKIPISRLLVGAPILLIASNFPFAFLGIGARETVACFLFSNLASSSSIVAGAALFSITDALLLAFIGLFWLPKFVSKLGSPDGNSKNKIEYRDNI